MFLFFLVLWLIGRSTLRPYLVWLMVVNGLRGIRKRLYFGGIAFCCMVLFICFQILVCYLATEAIFAGAVVVVELDEGLRGVGIGAWEVE